jgi:hypothetical protein
VIGEGELRCGHAELVEESEEVARIYSNIDHYGRRVVGRLEVTTTARGLPDAAEEVGTRAGVFLDRAEREEELGKVKEELAYTSEKPRKESAQCPYSFCSGGKETPTSYLAPTIESLSTPFPASSLSA